jgi:hypothetical protein
VRAARSGELSAEEFDARFDRGEDMSRHLEPCAEAEILRALDASRRQ